MRNNKLYGAAMLKDELSVVLEKVHSTQEIAKNLLAFNSNGNAEKEVIELLGKAVIIQKELNAITEELQKLTNYADEYYSGGEKFFMDVISLMQDALANNGKISSKRLLGIMGKAPELNIECSVQFGRC